MTRRQFSIEGGLYLVVNPAEGIDRMLPAVEEALAGGVDVLQIWNNWQADQDRQSFIDEMCKAAHAFDKPILIHDAWQWMLTTDLDGVHFDNVPADWNIITTSINYAFIKGITCGNDPERIEWAIANKVDYISFCSVYPSSTVETCDIVDPAIMKQTRKNTSIKIFGSGGITPQNTYKLMQLGIDGVAVISGILKANDPKKAAEQYKRALSNQTVL